MRASILLASLMGAAIVAVPVAFGSASSQDQAAPWGCPAGFQPSLAGGRNDVLKVYAELAAVCRLPGSGALTLGLRYAEARGSVLPFGALTLVWPLQGAQLRLSVGIRERLGDWEGDRLPELGLHWPVNFGLPLAGSLEGTVGLLSIYGADRDVTRAGLRLNLAPPSLPLGSAALSVTFDGGVYAYSGGRSHSFASGTIGLSLPVAPTTQVSLGYAHAEASGVSPLRFDTVDPDRSWTVTLRGTISRATVWRVGVLVDAVAGRGVREYQAGLSVGPNWLSVTYRTTDSQLLLGFVVSDWSVAVPRP